MDPLESDLTIKLENEDETYIPMSDIICQTCLVSTSKTKLKCMTEMCEYNGKAEVYLEMLEYCLSVKIFDNLESSQNPIMICESCIKRLREVEIFKNQVKDAQETIKLWIESKSDPVLSCIESKVECSSQNDDQIFDSECKTPDPLVEGDNDNLWSDDPFPRHEPICQSSSLTAERDVAEIVDGAISKNEDENLLFATLQICNKNKISSLKIINNKETDHIYKENVNTGSKKKQVKNKVVGKEAVCKKRKRKQSIKEVRKPLKIEDGNEMKKEDMIKIALESHIVYYHVDPFEKKCSICHLEFKKAYYLKKHIDLHLPDYICEECGWTCDNYLKYLKHRDKHFPCDEFTCPKCSVVYRREEHRNQHVRYRHSNRPRGHRCRLCPEYVIPSHKQKHMLEAHNKVEGVREVKCKICEKIYTHNSIHTHIRRVHQKLRNIVCEICGKAFFERKNLTKHKLSHGGQRNFPCAVCGKSYLDKYTLIAHMRIHSDVKRFVCDTCSQAFTYKCSLIGHIANHHERKDKKKKKPRIG